MNRKTYFCVFLALALCTSCSSRTAESALQPSQASSGPMEVVEEVPDALLDQMESLYALLETSPLPLKTADNFAPLDPSRDALPVQLVKDDDTAKQLASAICNLLDAYGNGLGNYAGPDELTMARTTTALYHTDPVDFTWEVDREGNFTCANPNHVLAFLVKREIDAGRTPVRLYYAEEVHKTAQKLFGDSARITDLDEPPYYYYDREGVYILMEDLHGNLKPVPQVVNYEKTDTGFKAEAVIVDSTGGKLEFDGEPLTKENFSTLTARAPRCQYTFRTEGERLVLESLTMRRPDVA